MTSAVPYAEVIGDPIAHSKSPLIHGFWLRKLGLGGEYLATRVTADNLHPYLAERGRDPAWRGCNVTMPLKQAVVPHAPHLGHEVELIGAANLLLPGVNGVLRAENTDVQGVAEPLSRLRQAEPVDHVATHVQIIGSGGAARAAGLGAIRAGYGDFDVFCRSRDSGLALARLVGARSGECRPLRALGPIRSPDDPGDRRYSHLIINATPMGMAGRPEVQIDLSGYHSDTIVFEMVYAPVETGLVRQARALSMRVVDGLEMLVGQAAHAFQALFGRVPPRQHDAELRALLTA